MKRKTRRSKQKELVTVSIKLLLWNTQDRASPTDLDGVMTLFECMTHVPEAVPGAVAHLMGSWCVL